MKALVVYSSRTGNTRKIAEAIAAVLPGCEIHPVESAPAPEGYDLVAVGYWVDKGMPDAQAKAYLETVRDAKVALFGTLGAWPDSDHARDCIAQGEALEQMGVEIDKVLNLTVEDSIIMERMSGRRVCAKCGASYHVKNKPSAKPGVCDRCGGELVTRKDDEPATVLDRLKAYHEQTEPLVAFYRERGKLVEIPDQGSIEATNALILKELEA